MQRFTFSLCVLVAGCALALSGCHNSDSGDEADTTQYDQIGEQHVYQDVKPLRREIPVPIPQRASEVIRRAPAVAQKSYDHVGEENVYDQ